MGLAMTAIPKEEKELVQLNISLNLYEENLERYALQTQEAYSYISLMEDFGHEFSEEYMIQFWLLNVCPLDASKDYKQGKKQSAEEEQKFLDKLEEEKKQFESNITSYKIEFENLKRFGDIKRVGEHAKASENLGLKLTAANDTLKDFNKREELFEMAKCKYENLEKLIEEFKPYRSLWDIAFYFDSSRENWMRSPIAKLDYENVIQV